MTTTAPANPGAPGGTRLYFLVGPYTWAEDIMRSRARAASEAGWPVTMKHAAKTLTIHYPDHDVRYMWIINSTHMRGLSGPAELVLADRYEISEREMAGLRHHLAIVNLSTPRAGR